MKLKKLIILLVLAALGFTGSFFVSKMLSPEPEPVEAEAAEPEILDELDLTAAGQETAASEMFQMKEHELTRLIKELRLRQRVLDEREQDLNDREKRLGLAEQLLDSQAKELEALRVQLVTPLTRLRETISELENSRLLIAEEEQSNLKKLAGTYDKMDARSGAEILLGMCRNNQEADAVKILYFMGDRQVADMLAAMPEDMAGTLVTKLKTIRENQKG